MHGRLISKKDNEPTPSVYRTAVQRLGTRRREKLLRFWRHLTLSERMIDHKVQVQKSDQVRYGSMLASVRQWQGKHMAVLMSGHDCFGGLRPSGISQGGRVGGFQTHD